MRRIIVNTYRNIRRSPYQALAAIMVLTLTSLVAYIFILFLISSQTVMQYFETRPQVSAFFKDEVKEASLLEIKGALEKQPYVAKITYVSKAEALKIYQEQNKDDPLLLEMVTAEILPASLEVSANTIDDLPKIKSYFDNTAGVDEVIYQQDIIDALKKWSNAIKVTGVALLTVLGVTSLLIITIIISMKVSSKRAEIATLKLLGATPAFIYLPYIFEGIFYGLVGALTAWVIVYVMLLYATPMLVNFMGDIPLLPIPITQMLLMLGGVFGITALLGVVSGSLSSRRYGS